MPVMMSEDMDVSCTQTNWETSGSPARGVQMSEVQTTISPSFPQPALKRLSKGKKDISLPAHMMDKQQVRFHIPGS